MSEINLDSPPELFCSYLLLGCQKGGADLILFVNNWTMFPARRVSTQPNVLVDVDVSMNSVCRVV